MTISAAEAKTRLAAFDLRQLPQAYYDDPYPWYHALLEREPVKRLPDGSILLSRYDDINQVYKNPKVFSSDKRKEFKPKYGNSPLYEHHTTSLVFNDPPLHTRVRRLVAGALTPRAIDGMAPALVRLVDHLLDHMAGKEAVDLIDDFASAIPLEVIGNLLDVPHDEREPLRDWSLSILGALEPSISKDVFDKGNRSVTDFLAYLDRLVRARRKAPGDPEHDVLTRLIMGEENGEKLSVAELLHNCIFLLNAGHETTTNLIGNGLAILAEYPDEKIRLIRNPGLIKTAIEEFLRFESPNQLGNRITTEDVTIGGVKISAGTPITLCIGAGNRDPRKFPNPDQPDVGRAPNRHLAFASGIHQCAGMNLARLEAQIAISGFLERFPDYQITGQAVRGGRARFRGFLSLPCNTGTAR